jgi:hypothetical protein
VTRILSAIEQGNPRQGSPAAIQGQAAACLILCGVRIGLRGFLDLRASRRAQLFGPTHLCTILRYRFVNRLDDEPATLNDRERLQIEAWDSIRSPVISVPAVMLLRLTAILPSPYHDRMNRHSRAREVALQLLYQRDLNLRVPRNYVEAFVAMVIVCARKQG